MGVRLNLGPHLSSCVDPVDTSSPCGGPCRAMLGQERSGGGGHSTDAGRAGGPKVGREWGGGGGYGSGGLPRHLLATSGSMAPEMHIQASAEREAGKGSIFYGAEKVLAGIGIYLGLG